MNKYKQNISGLMAIIFAIAFISCQFFFVVQAAPVQECSNFTELKNAVNSAGDGDIINISADITFDANESLEINKSLTFKSGKGNGTPAVLTAAANSRHMNIIGGDITLTFDQTILDGNTMGGGIYVDSTASSFTLENGMIRNCTAVKGGAVEITAGKNPYCQWQHNQQ